MSKQTQRKGTKKIAWDPQKDSIFKDLAAACESGGYSVRREELKQGHGWKAVSGSCRLETQRLIFVDKKLPQDEQIAFLAHRVAALGLKLADDKIATLPENVRAILQANASSIAA